MVRGGMPNWVRGGMPNWVRDVLAWLHRRWSLDAHGLAQHDVTVIAQFLTHWGQIGFNGRADGTQQSYETRAPHSPTRPNN